MSVHSAWQHDLSIAQLLQLVEPVVVLSAQKESVIMDVCLGNKANSILSVD